MPQESSGSIANKTGKSLENFVDETLKSTGYEWVDKKKFKASFCLNQKIYTRQLYLCQTIYDTKWIADFALYIPDHELLHLVIECKWQQIGGTVDEKFPYLVMNIKEKSPYPAIIMLDGQGYKAGAKNWLKNQIDDKLIDVLNKDEFVTWINKRFKK